MCMPAAFPVNATGTGFAWHTGGGNYQTVTNNAYGNWYGISCHGGSFRGMGRNRRCTSKSNFKQVRATCTSLCIVQTLRIVYHCMATCAVHSAWPSC